MWGDWVAKFMYTTPFHAGRLVGLVHRPAAHAAQWVALQPILTGKRLKKMETS